MHERLKRFQESARNLPSSYFRSEFEELSQMEDHHARGRYFDHFIGLLFCQIDGLRVQVKDKRSEGEVDVVITCLDADEWLFRAVGCATVVENKWQDGGATQGDANQFRPKAEEVATRTLCRAAYFFSVDGYTSDAEESLRGDDDPIIVLFDSEDIDDIIEEGTPENAIRESIL